MEHYEVTLVIETTQPEDRSIDCAAFTGIPFNEAWKPIPEIFVVFLVDEESAAKIRPYLAQSRMFDLAHDGADITMQLIRGHWCEIHVIIPSFIGFLID